MILNVIFYEQAMSILVKFKFRISDMNFSKKSIKTVNFLHFVKKVQVIARKVQDFWVADGVCLQKSFSKRKQKYFFFENS
jgi:hypothetical protein